MGYHRRIISKEQLIYEYTHNGLPGIQEFLGSSGSYADDAVMITDDLAKSVIDVFTSYFPDEMDKWRQIKNIILTEIMHDD